MATAQTPPELVLVGQVSGLYGVHGWLRIYSYTEPRENILTYTRWYLKRADRWEPVAVAEGRRHGKGVVVRFAGCDDRDAAATLLGSDIAVYRDELPPAEPGEYYWSDLEGLRVVTTTGVDLGVVDHLFSTGANDVVVVKGERERLLPFLQGEVIMDIDLAARCMTVDWDPDF